MKVMHKSIPAAPILPLPLGICSFWSWIANSLEREHLSCQVPRGGDEKIANADLQVSQFHDLLHIVTS